jgi:hypothetical protein
MIRKVIGLCTLSLLVLGVLAPAAGAAEAEPSIIASAWYWEQQQNENVATPVGNVAVEAPNPFCPGLPSSLGSPPETCAEGRLPVAVVNGDYETPDMVSAVTFDLTLVPIGSKVSSFTLTMLEAESGCYEDPDTQTGQQCEQTDAVNAAGKEIQACVVNELFGDGEARPYKEVPKFTCSNSDPVATRKEVPNDAEADPTDSDPDHVWTFDLGALAQKWAQKPPLCTCVIFRPKAPKGDGGQGEDGNWRVVFAGPKFPDGVVTSLRFTAPPGGGTLPPPPPSAPPTSDPGSLGTSGTSTIGGGLDDTSSGDLGDTGGAGETAAAGEADDPVAADAENAGAELPEVEAMPGYVWLALLASVVAWSMVRSIILENTKGIRPNGVLAQIHQINSSRAGAATTAGASGGPLEALRAGAAAIGGAMKPLGEKVTSLIGKLPGSKKG